MSSPRRVSIIGCTGSGKTTLSKTLADKWKLERIEQDSLFHLPNWQTRSREEFSELVFQRTRAERYVIDGNYSHARERYWSELDLIILLDFPFPIVFFRLLRRTLKRCLTREELWSGNRETLRKSFFSKDSILLWQVMTHRRRSLDARRIESNPPRPECKVLRFTHPNQLHAWLTEPRSAE